jgi:hypothetical protein
MSRCALRMFHVAQRDTRYRTQQRLTVAMTALERKVAFRSTAELAGRNLNVAALEICGVTWDHLSAGIADKRPLALEAKQKFAEYIGRSVEEVFGETADAA